MMRVDRPTVEIRPISGLSPALMAKLLKFDRESQRINFPRDRTNPAQTRARVRQEFREEPEGMNLVYVGGKLAGCLFLKTGYNPYRRERFLDLRNIYLSPRYRGAGLGQELLAFMERYAVARRCRYLFLGTSYSNSEAVEAFRRFGFRPTRVLMEKRLARRALRKPGKS